jgi:hypothetical protein
VLTLSGSGFTSFGCDAGESFTPNFNTNGTTGITVVSAVYDTDTTATIIIDIAAGATLGFRDVVFDWDPGCGHSDDTLFNGFEVTVPPSVCGDGIVEGAEDCDPPPGAEDSATCDDDCTTPMCGDGCDNNCTATACGNGIVTAGETCDDGL